MQDRLKPQSDKSKDTDATKAAETRLKSAGEVIVTHHDTPPPGPADKRIHPRRPLPPVPAAPPKPQAKKESDSDTGTDEP